ncbi:MAG: hypothetical protein AAB296_07585, partial [Candidatus Desantisbacteria bacterium]
STLGTPTSTDGGTLTWTCASLPPAGTSGAIIMVRIGTDTAITELVNVMSAVCEDEDGPDYNNEDTWTTKIGVPDLEICKYGPGDIVPGHEISYDINFKNVGDVGASGITITDTLPLGVTYVSDTSGMTHTTTGSGTLESPQVLTWTIGELLPEWEMENKGYGYFTLICQAGESFGSETSLTNVISISTALGEKDTANNQATCTSQIQQPYLDLGISKYGEYDVVAGNKMSYWVKYYNNSNVAVGSITIIDYLPGGVRCEEVKEIGTPTISGSGTSDSPQILRWDIGRMEPWNERWFQLVVSVDNTVTGILANTITITTLPDDADTSNNQAVSWTKVILPVADLSIGKDGPWKAMRGEEITYSVQVNNYSRFDASDVSVVDLLPQGVTYSTNTLGIEPAIGSVTGSLIWNLGSLPAWGSRYFQITCTIDENSPFDSLINVVNVQSSSYEEILENNQATVTTTIEDRSFDLFINKGGAGWNEKPVIGENYTYYISFGNQGNTDVGSVTIVDTLPAGVSYVSNTNLGSPTRITGSGTTLSPYVLTWEIGILPPSYWYYNNYLELIVHLDDTIGDGAELVNVANISTSMFGTETDDANNYATFTVTASQPVVDLVISKSGWPYEAAPGQEITYWISYSNQGNSLSGAGTITDTLPADVTYVDTEDNWWNKNRLGTPTPSGNILEWYFDFIEPGEWGWLQVKVKVNEGIGTLSLTNQISITSNSLDTNLDNNGDSFTTQVVPPKVDLTIEKWGTSEIVRDNASAGGEKVSYTIVLRNMGNSDAHGAKVVDTLPIGMRYGTDTSGIPHTISGSGTLESPYQITWDYGTLTMSGWREVIRFELIGTVSDDAVSPLTNVVEVSCSGQDTNPDNNRATMTTYIVQPEVDLGVWKGGDIEGVPGQEIEYQVYYWNKGNANAHGVVIVDHLPSGLVYISDTGNGTIATTTARGTKIRWEIGKLGTGWNSYGYFTVKVKIAEDVTVGSVLDNVISIKSLLSNDSYPENNRATATITVAAPMADLCISKYAAIRQVAEGDTISYWINYRNNGNSPATNVIMTDY